MSRYKVMPWSVSYHCCFDASVVDTSRPTMIGDKQYEDRGELQFDCVCECFDAEDAKKVCDAMNAADELDRLRAANARQRAWIDEVMGQEAHSLAAVPYVFAACFVPPEHALTMKTVELITRPAPFEDK